MHLHHGAQPKQTDGLLEGVSQPSHPDITQAVTKRPDAVAGHDQNLRQEPPPLTEEDLQTPRRRRQAVADQEAEADDDSDMYLEPDEEPQRAAQPQATPSMNVARYEQPQAQSQNVARFEETHEAPQSEHVRQYEEPQGAAQPQSMALYEYGGDGSVDNQGRPQHFFPSFAPVFSLGHSRPPQLYHPIAEESEFYKQRGDSQSLRSIGEFNPFRSFREAFQVAAPEPKEEAPSNNNLLGSGNFGVIRGGTYYNDEDRSSYYNNGHGRPYFNNPLPQKYTGGDFFANFRDFADINVSPKGAFSEYVIVYVNKNGTVPHLSDPTRPKNIIEQLSLLDRQKETTSAPEKKMSSHKRKLSVLKKGEEGKEVRRVLRKKETVKDFYEPLLALS